jgi:hypothetical protein
MPRGLSASSEVELAGGAIGLVQREPFSSPHGPRSSYAPTPAAVFL